MNGRLGSLTAMSAILAAMGQYMGDMHISQMMGTPLGGTDDGVHYDESEVPKRGGRWRALARWRNWWATEHRPATRMTSRRAL